MKTNKTILVTGCAGFIGSRVVQLLCEDPTVRVVGIDNLNDYYDPVLKYYRLHCLQRLDNFEFHAVDIEDVPLLTTLFEQHAFAAVINLAARAGVRYSLENPHVYETTNALGSLNLLSLSARFGVTKFVLASTSSLYAGHTPPYREDSPVDTPISPYAASKRAAEMMAYTFHHLYDIDVSILRYFTVYGPAGRPDMAYFRFIQSVHQRRPLIVFGDGEQSRDFTFVDDIARGTIAATRNVGFEIINLGGGNRPTTINQMIEILESQLGQKAVVEYRAAHAADMATTQADASKADRLLDWRAVVSLEDGLKACVDWYLENVEWSSQISLETGGVRCSSSAHPWVPTNTEFSNTVDNRLLWRSSEAIGNSGSESPVIVKFPGGDSPGLNRAG